MLAKLSSEKKGRVGKTPPLRIVSFFFSDTKVKCVQKSYHSFSDNDINYKPMLVRFTSHTMFEKKIMSFWKYNYICIN